MGKLTAMQAKQASKPGLINDGDGLYLCIAPGGSKSWIFRYRTNGRLRKHGLGSFKTLTLADARARALECRRMRLDGIDPIEAKKARIADEKLEKARAISFADCAETFITAQEPGWKSKKSPDQWRSSLKTYAFPVCGDLPVCDVQTEQITKILDPIWSKKTETATRLRSRMERILDWARTMGYREGENPARWRGHLQNIMPPPSKVRTVKHHEALPYKKIAGFWRELGEQATETAAGLGFLILTAARNTEVRRATWDEIDWDAREWIVPAERMKAGRIHRVPLTEAALTILRRQHKHRTSNLIFNSPKIGKPNSENAFRELLIRMGHAKVTAHGFRSTFADWAADCTDYKPEIREAALAHKIPDKVVSAYQRTDFIDRRRDLMNDWADYVEGSLTLKS